MKFRESLKEKVSGIFSVFKASEDGAGLQKIIFSLIGVVIVFIILVVLATPLRATVQGDITRWLVVRPVLIAASWIRY